MEPLTWYPGTILPYASLWHTLLRATWLNDLRAGDIHNLVEGKRRRKGESPFKERGARDVRTVVLALGETRRALSKFAVAEQFPFSLRTTFMLERLRWCPTCVAGGFHTLLGSIRLMTRCPIHEMPLIDACPGCGESFGMRFRGLAVRLQPCRCGRTRLLDPESARQPSLRAEDVAVWAPVARWVRQVSAVTRSASPNSRLPLQVHLALTARWCRDLGIGYPDCFDDESSLWPDAEEANRWSSYKALSGDLRGVYQPELSDTPSQSSVYGAMGRHLRRHGLHHPDRWIRLLMGMFDPAAFAMTMAARPKARLAFTEMLWSRRLEPRSFVHRWPNRPAPFSSDLDATWAKRTPIPLQEGIARSALGGPPVSPRAQRWVAYHAMAMEARLAWDRAWRQTQKSIADRWANWSTEDWEMGDEPPLGRIVWFSRPKGPGMQFVGYVRDAVDARFSAGMPTKQERRDALADARLEPHRRVVALAHRACLGWSEREGWRVEPGALPDDDDVRRVTLLHTGQRTACWIFRSGERFVVRLVEGVIQASGATAGEALAGLRGAVIQYRRTYDAEHASKTEPAEIQPLLPEYAEATRRVTILAGLMRGTDRFWAAGKMVHHEGVRCSILQAEKHDA